jgi:hypothetical protein
MSETNKLQETLEENRGGRKKAMTTASAPVKRAMLGVSICEWARKWVGRLYYVQYETLKERQCCSACGRQIPEGNRAIAYLHSEDAPLRAVRWIYLHEDCSA